MHKSSKNMFVMLMSVVNWEHTVLPVQQDLRV